MAHFAELNTEDVVLRVLVVNNDITYDAGGQEHEERGIAHLQRLFGPNTRWVQTSYNSNFRGRYAGIGFAYDSVADVFVPPEPEPEPES